MRVLIRTTGVLLFLLGTVAAAQARPHHYHHRAAAQKCDPLAWFSPCGVPWGGQVPKAIRREPLRAHGGTVAGGGGVVGHPAGCPRRAFCGCGAAVRVFGTPRRDLWLAAAWLRFPRAAPAPGMVAARRGHVFVLEQHVVGNTWLAYDANSGGHATRIHQRSIAGYAIVNPRV